MENMNANVDTFLDPAATLQRLRNMEAQSDTVKATIDETKGIMDTLQSFFVGNSATMLQNEYAEVEATFQDFRQYLQEKVELMEGLTTNIERTDEQ